MSAQELAIEYIRKTYDVSAKIGGRVQFSPEYGLPWIGTIIGAENGYLHIIRNGDDSAYPALLHPQWNLTYFVTE